jgi:hypothetical protein
MNRYGRVGEIFLSLLEVAPTDEIRDHLIEFERGVFEDQKEDEATRLEAGVVKAILSCRILAIDKRLAIRIITDNVNAERDQNDKISSERVGWETSRLGFKKARMPNGNRAICLDSALLQRLIHVYDIKEPSDGQTVNSVMGLDRYSHDGSDSLTVKRGAPVKVLSSSPTATVLAGTSVGVTSSSSPTTDATTVKITLTEPMKRYIKACASIQQPIDTFTDRLKERYPELQSLTTEQICVLLRHCNCTVLEGKVVFIEEQVKSVQELDKVTITKPIMQYVKACASIQQPLETFHVRLVEKYPELENIPLEQILQECNCAILEGKVALVGAVDPT